MIAPGGFREVVDRYIPSGFALGTDGRSLIPNKKEQEGIRTMGELRAQGLSLRQIAARLAKADIQTKTGARWSPEAINMILRRKAG